MAAGVLARRARLTRSLEILIRSSLASYSNDGFLLWKPHADAPIAGIPWMSRYSSLSFIPTNIFLNCYP